MSDYFNFYSISALSAAVPAVYGLLKWRKLTVALKIIVSFVLMFLFFDILTYVMGMLKVSNTDVIHTCLFFQITLGGIYFMNLYSEQKHYVKAHFVIIVLTGILLFFFITRDSESVRLSTSALTLASASILIHCGIFLIDLIRNKIDEPLENNYNFLIVASLFFYFSSVFVIFLTYNILDSDQITFDFWKVKLATYIFCNLIIFYALFKYVKVHVNSRN